METWRNEQNDVIWNSLIYIVVCVLYLLQLAILLSITLYVCASTFLYVNMYGSFSPALHFVFRNGVSSWIQSPFVWLVSPADPQVFPCSVLDGHAPPHPLLHECCRTQLRSSCCAVGTLLMEPSLQLHTAYFYQTHRGAVQELMWMNWGVPHSWGAHPGKCSVYCL